MARQTRRNGGDTATDAVDPVGSVRRSQLISTFGIGAILDLEKGSFMPMGLEDWAPVSGLPSLRIREPRLEQMLDVDHFRLGPVKEDVKGSQQVRARSAGPVVRFPQWQECPICHRIGTQGNPFELASDGARLICVGCGQSSYTNPVRFVVACRSGHLNDFPWEWWAHRDEEDGICKNPVLYLRSRGRSASLADLYVECRNCGSKDRPVRRSLGDAFGADAMKNQSCSGFRPWLYDRQDDCKDAIRTLQRGASNIHFPTVCSTLSIPPASEAICQIIIEIRDMIEHAPDSAVPGILTGMAQTYGVPPDQMISAWRQIQALESGHTSLTEKLARAEEYAALSNNRDDPEIGGMVPQFKNIQMEIPEQFSGVFDRIGAVSRLREVRALAGFSRIEPYPVSAERVGEAIRNRRLASLSKSSKNWLPAAEIRGEGVFVRFRTDAIDTWAGKNPTVLARAAALNDRHHQIAAERGYEPDYDITPRLLLVHSFSHALLRQISFDCGYSSSALRERLYIAEPSDDADAMNGVLIYTGSPDSEGSLGGLVRLASPELLGPILVRALSNAGWCGSDPVCRETDPEQAGDRLSGAACHSCLLLPETACEKFNRELDRLSLTGNKDDGDPFRGFFNELIRTN